MCRDNQASGGPRRPPRRGCRLRGPPPPLTPLSPVLVCHPSPVRLPRRGPPLARHVSVHTRRRPMQVGSARSTAGTSSPCHPRSLCGLWPGLHHPMGVSAVGCGAQSAALQGQGHSRGVSSFPLAAVRQADQLTALSTINRSGAVDPTQYVWVFGWCAEVSDPPTKVRPLFAGSHVHDGVGLWLLDNKANTSKRHHTLAHGLVHVPVHLCTHVSTHPHTGRGCSSAFCPLFISLGCFLARQGQRRTRALLERGLSRGGQRLDRQDPPCLSGVCCP